MGEGIAKLYQKIFAVYQDIKYLQKDDNISFGQTNYKAISEEKVTMAVRDSLIKNRLIVLPVEQDHKKDGNLTTVDTKYKIIDIDTGEYEVLVSSGTGVDTQDKGVGKAMTYAYKYLFLRSFAIPTGDDPDKISSAELDGKQANREPKAQNKPDKKNGPTLEAIKAKWEILYGSLDLFDDWYKGQSEKYSNNQIDTYLTKKLVEKNKSNGAA